MRDGTEQRLGEPQICKLHQTILLRNLDREPIRMRVGQGPGPHQRVAFTRERLKDGHKHCAPRKVAADAAEYRPMRYNWAEDSISENDPKQAGFKPDQAGSCVSTISVRGRMSISSCKNGPL